MKITKKEIQTKEVEVIDDILCNKCGRSCREGGGEDFYGLIEIEVSGGYFSPMLGDCTHWTFSLCEYCLDEFFKTFKHKPKLNEYF